MTLKDLIIPFFTILVVILQSLFSLVSKWIDVTQKKEDHKQELRTIHFNRKIEVGEILIGRWTLLIRNLDNITSFFKKFDLRYYADVELYNAAADKQIAMNQKIDEFVLSDKNYFYAYFDDTVMNITGITEASSSMAKHRELLLAIMNKRVMLGIIDDEDDEGKQEVWEMMRDYDKALKDFLQDGRTLKAQYKNCCTAVRKELEP